jgi:hypothetical protein
MSAGTGAGPAVSQQEERRRGCGARGLFGLGRSLGRLGELWREKKWKTRGWESGPRPVVSRPRAGGSLSPFFFYFIFQKSFEQNK